jgi:pimeloyl-ACP methyl ester carboxylesterase
VSRGAKAVVWVCGCLLVLVTLVPLVIPVRPAPGTLPAAEVAPGGGRFVEVEGISVYLEEAGDGEPALILLHGFGASVFSFREVIEPLTEWARVVAFDRPGFGFTERPRRGGWQGANPYGVEGQAGLTVALMDELGVDRAVLIGHSAGAAVAARVAIVYPERVDALILVAPAILTSGGAPGWVRPLLAIPQIDRLGPLAVRGFVDRLEGILDRSWYDASRLTDGVREGYKAPLRVDGWDRGLWEILRAPSAGDIAGRLSEICVPVLVLSGTADEIVPPSDSLAVAEAVPGARFALIDETGHVPHEERPADFVMLIEEFLKERVFASQARARESKSSEEW